MLPVFDNNDSRIRRLELLLEGDLSGKAEIPLPRGYHYEMYREGDREAWIGIEKSAKEFKDEAEGREAWNRYYGGRETELAGRMCFVADSRGKKVATATAYEDITGRDRSGAAWLHWVAVCREEQGKGLSKPLISHVLGIMRAQGYEKAKVPTQTSTWVAVKVYLDLGFRPIPENARHSREGWRIIRRLTGHSALSDFSPAEDWEVLDTQKLKAAVLDLDGTLLRRDKTLSDYTRGILAECRKKGVRILAATARPERAVPGNVLNCFDAAATLNGARMLLSEGEKTAAIPIETGKRVLKGLLEVREPELSIETDRGLFSNVPIPEWTPFAWKEFPAFPEGSTLYKILLRSGDREIQRKVASSMTDGVYYTTAEGTLYQIMSRQATKWQGVLEMLEGTGIGAEGVLYIGDDFDDLEPIRKAGLGAAVANCVPAVGEAADLIIESNEADGPARLLEKIFLRGPLPAGS